MTRTPFILTFRLNYTDLYTELQIYEILPSTQPVRFNIQDVLPLRALFFREMSSRIHKGERRTRFEKDVALTTDRTHWSKETHSLPAPVNASSAPMKLGFSQLRHKKEKKCACAIVGMNLIQKSGQKLDSWVDKVPFRWSSPTIPRRWRYGCLPLRAYLSRRNSNKSVANTYWPFFLSFSSLLRCAPSLVNATLCFLRKFCIIKYSSSFLLSSQMRSNIIYRGAKRCTKLAMVSAHSIRRWVS